MNKYAVINTSTNLVENIIVWDGETSWEPPPGHISVNVDGLDVGIGWTYNNGSATPPAPTPMPTPSTPTVAELSAQLTALQAQIAALTSKS
jgi:hypothetical protein